MRLLLKIVLVLSGTFVSIVLATFCWVYFYSKDLPDTTALSSYAPATVAQVSDPCIARSIVLPYEAIGANVRNAIKSVEFNETDPSALSELLYDTLGTHRLPRRTLSQAISVGMFCSPSRNLKKRLEELRTAIQLDRKYSKKQLFTILANRVTLGSSVVGIQEGSQFYFQKDANNLSIPEAALLAGLIRAPSYYSPFKHPDRAIRRRSEVIKAMIENGSISQSEAQKAESAPLGVVPGNQP